jgi:hypothetical protein
MTTMMSEKAQALIDILGDDLAEELLEPMVRTKTKEHTMTIRYKDDTRQRIEQVIRQAQAMIDGLRSYLPAEDEDMIEELSADWPKGEFRNERLTADLEQSIPRKRQRQQRQLATKADNTMAWLDDMLQTQPAMTSKDDKDAQRSYLAEQNGTWLDDFIGPLNKL